MKDVYAVVLGGGKGERLWPYSRQDRPKQFIPFLEGRTLIERTVDRCRAFTDNIFVVAEPAINKMALDIVGNSVGFFEEPFARNTAPAVALTCFEIYAQNPNAIVVLLPADHFIPDLKSFAEKIKKAMHFVSNEDKLCLLGLEPTRPATGYGYIEVDLCEKEKVVPVKKFHEKPSIDIAKQYLQDGNKLWNLGIFVGKASVFLQEFETCAPDIYKKVSTFCKSKDVEAYKSIKGVSIDCAVMEKSRNVVVMPVDFAWDDVGNLDVFLRLNNFKRDIPIVELNSQNNYVDVKDKLVALVGIDGVYVIEQEDVILVIKKESVDEVRDVVELLRQNKQEKFC